MIAQDMTRLSGEISALHAQRAALLNNLTRGSEELTASMAGFCTRLAEARNGMAKRTKSERQAFVQKVKDEVNAQRRGVATDLAEVRRVWSGRAS